MAQVFTGWSGCPFYQPINSVKAPKETQGTDPNRGKLPTASPFLDPLPFAGLLREMIFSLCYLSSANDL